MTDPLMAVVALLAGGVLGMFDMWTTTLLGGPAGRAPVKTRRSGLAVQTSAVHEATPLDHPC